MNMMEWESCDTRDTTDRDRETIRREDDNKRTTWLMDQESDTYMNGSCSCGWRR